MIVGGIGVLIADTVKKNIPEETSERGSGTSLTETPETSAAPVEESATDLPFPTAPVQTREITTQEVTTEEPVTVPITTPEPTTEEITTAAPTLPVTQPPTVPADPSTAVFVPTHVEGSTLTGRTEKGYDIEVKDGITYVAGLMIANKTYSLPSSYTAAGGKLVPEAEKAFNEMKAAAAKEGIKFRYFSGYRSYELQTSLYNRYVKNDGKAAADRYSARPGHSEHQTGLAFDITDDKYTMVEGFKNTAAGKWLAANGWKYGFILRYPENGEEITGYMFEPWHFRYIGSNAAAIYSSGFTLEEFLGITSVYPD